jgi:hypothetical protein
MSTTAAFWLGFLTAHGFAVVVLLAVLLMGACPFDDSEDETMPATQTRIMVPWPGRKEFSRRSRPRRAPGCGND